MVGVDEFELAGGAPDGDPRPAARGAVARAPRARAWVALAIGMVVAGAVAAAPVPLIVGRGDGPDLGLTDLDLADTPSVVWETSVSAGWVIDARGDRAVVATQGSRTGRVLVGLDLATGDQVWRYDDVDSSCRVGSPMVCVERPGTAEAVLVTITLDDGDQSRRPYPRALAAIAAGDDGSIVVVARTDSAQEDVALIDAAGAEVWQRSADASDTTADTAWTWLSIAEGKLRLDQSQTSIDLRTGETSPYAGRLVLEDGTPITFGSEQTIIGSGADAVAIPTGEAIAYVNDDLGGVVQLTGTGILSASIRATGEWLWSFERSPCDLEARISGVVVLTCWDGSSSSTQGFDEVTGEVLWEQQDVSLIRPSSRDALVFARNDSADLLAIDPTTGAPRWELAAADRTIVTGTTSTSNGILLVTSNSMVRLAWD